MAVSAHVQWLGCLKAVERISGHFCRSEMRCVIQLTDSIQGRLSFQMETFMMARLAIKIDAHNVRK